MFSTFKGHVWRFAFQVSGVGAGSEEVALGCPHFVAIRLNYIIAQTLKVIILKYKHCKIH